MTAWSAVVAILSMAPGILLTGAAVHLYRRRRIPRSGLVVVVSVAALTITAGVLGLTGAPRWLTFGLILAALPVGYGYAAVMSRRHLRRPAPARAGR